MALPTPITDIELVMLLPEAHHNVFGIRLWSYLFNIASRLKGMTIYGYVSVRINTLNVEDMSEDDRIFIASMINVHNDNYSKESQLALIDYMQPYIQLLKDNGHDYWGTRYGDGTEAFDPSTSQNYNSNSRTTWDR